MSVQEPSHYAEEDMVLVAGSDYIRMASIGGGLLSIKLPTAGDSTPIVEGVSGELLAVNGGTYVDQGRLAVTHIRESGDGTGISLPGNIMMYNPNGNPKEITYSNDIPIRLNTFDVSLNGHDDRLNVLDISVNIIDVSLNGLDISVNIIDVSLNVHDDRLNGLDISVNIIDVSLNVIDSTLYSGSTFAIGAGSSATGTNSFAIGNNATTSTYDNAVAIGNGSSVGADNVICLGDGTQNVGIGVTSPVYTLDISAGTLGSDTDASLNYVRFKSTNPNMSYLDIYERRFNTAGDWQTAATRIQKMIDITKHGYIEFDPPSNGGGLAFGASNGEKMTITSNGNVGIGTTSPIQKLSIQDGNLGVFNSTYDIMALFAGSYGNYLHIGCWNQAGNTSKNIVLNQYGGRVGIGTTAPQQPLHIHSNSVAAIRFTSSNSSYRHFQMYAANNGLYFQAPYDSGNVHWRNAGYIAATSSTAWHSFAWNFTGQHRTFIENVLHTDASNNQGLIVCANKNTYMSMSNKLEKGNKAITQNESLPLVSLSTKSNDKSCFGVISESEDPQQRSDRCGNFVTPYEKEDGDTRIYINSVGEGAIWVSNKNGSLESGDYITTSNIPGYGEKQDSVFLANYTVAKITMDCDFNPQLQPSEIILKQETLDASGNTIYENVLDDNGMLQWTNELDGSGNIVYEYPYNLRYLDLSGNRYSKDDYDTKTANNEEVYIAAYVGCTYHCG